MMIKKKVLAIAAAASMVIPAFTFSASAKNGDQIKVGGLNVKLATDFNNFEDGMRVGENDNIFYAPENKIKANKGINFHIADKAGVDGSKGLVYGAMQGIDPAQGCYAGVEYKPEKDNGGIINWQGATDFVFWMDCTKEPSKEASVQIVIQEYDMDNNGNYNMIPDPESDNGQQKKAKTFRNLCDDADNIWYTLGEDGKWVEHKGTSQSWIKLPNTFKGYVRVPLDSFFLCWPGCVDDNEKFDLMHVYDIGFWNGLYTRHWDAASKQSITIDNIGFAGNFDQQQQTTKNNTATTTTTAKATSTTSAKSDTSSPATGETPITAALVTAAVFTGVLVVSKKRMK